MLSEILERLDAPPGTVGATGALSHISRCLPHAAREGRTTGHAALLEIETAAPVLYAKRTSEEKRAALRARIRQLCAELQPV